MGQYYGLDWAAYILCIFQMYLVGVNCRWGWIFGIAAAICGLGFGLLAGSMAAVSFNVIYVILYFVNFVRWTFNPPIKTSTLSVRHDCDSEGNADTSTIAIVQPQE